MDKDKKGVGCQSSIYYETEPQEEKTVLEESPKNLNWALADQNILNVPDHLESHKLSKHRNSFEPSTPHKSNTPNNGKILRVVQKVVQI